MKHKHCFSGLRAVQGTDPLILGPLENVAVTNFDHLAQYNSVELNGAVSTLPSRKEHQPISVKYNICLNHWSHLLNG